MNWYLTQKSLFHFFQKIIFALFFFQFSVFAEVPSPSVSGVHLKDLQAQVGRIKSLIEADKLNEYVFYMQSTLDQSGVATEEATRKLISETSIPAIFTHWKFEQPVACSDTQVRTGFVFDTCGIEYQDMGWEKPLDVKIHYSVFDELENYTMFLKAENLSSVEIYSKLIEGEEDRPSYISHSVNIFVPNDKNKNRRLLFQKAFSSLENGNMFDSLQEQIKEFALNDVNISSDMN